MFAHLIEPSAFFYIKSSDRSYFYALPIIKDFCEIFGPRVVIYFISYRFLDRLVRNLEEKKHHEVKLKDGLRDLSAKRMELQNSMSSSWPKQVSIVFSVSGSVHQLLDSRLETREWLVF